MESGCKGTCFISNHQIFGMICYAAVSDGAGFVPIGFLPFVCLLLCSGCLSRSLCGWCSRCGRCFLRRCCLSLTCAEWLLVLRTCQRILCGLFHRTLLSGGSGCYVCANHAQHDHGDSQSPRDFFNQVGCLSYAGKLVGTCKIGGKSSTLRLLNQHDEYHQECCNDNENYE